MPETPPPITTNWSRSSGTLERLIPSHQHQPRQGPGTIHRAAVRQQQQANRI